jgi:hypothetical protein
MNEIYLFIGLPCHDLQESEVSVKNCRQYKPMKKDTREMLKQFYEPYDKRLVQLLKDNNIDIPLWP